MKRKEAMLLMKRNREKEKEAPPLSPSPQEAFVAASAKRPSDSRMIDSDSTSGPPARPPSFCPTAMPGRAVVAIPLDGSFSLLSPRHHRPLRPSRRRQRNY